MADIERRQCHVADGRASSVQRTPASGPLTLRMQPTSVVKRTGEKGHDGLITKKREFQHSCPRDVRELTDAEHQGRLPSRLWGF